MVTVAPDNVHLMLIKRAEDGEGVILRLLETDGVDTQATITIGEKSYSVAVGHNAIETYRYESGSLQAVNLLEETQA